MSSVPRDGRMFRRNGTILDEASLLERQEQVVGGILQIVPDINKNTEQSVNALLDIDSRLQDQNARQALWTEPFTKFVTQISSDHAYVHAGLAWTAIITPGSISGSYKLGFVTPDKVAVNLVIHWRPIGISSSANYVGFRLYEDNAYTEGTNATLINRDRVGDSHVTAMQDFKQGVTATLTGALLQAGGVGTEGRPQARAGGGAAADQELVLRPDTSYVMDFVPAGATTVVIELFWYEEAYNAGV